MRLGQRLASGMASRPVTLDLARDDVTTEELVSPRVYDQAIGKPCGHNATFALPIVGAGISLRMHVQAIGKPCSWRHVFALPPWELVSPRALRVAAPVCTTDCMLIL